MVCLISSTFFSRSWIICWTSDSVFLNKACQSQCIVLNITNQIFLQLFFFTTECIYFVGNTTFCHLYTNAPKLHISWKGHISSQCHLTSASPNLTRCTVLLTMIFIFLNTRLGLILHIYIWIGNILQTCTVTEHLRRFWMAFFHLEIDCCALQYDA